MEKSIPRVLLIVSADVERDAALRRSKESPRRDYLRLAEVLGADIFDISLVSKSRLGRLMTRIVGRGPTHALFALGRARRYDVVFSDSERVGLFVGVLLRMLPNRPRHVLLAHYLTPRKKHLLVRLASPGIDRFVLHAEAQREFAIQRLGLSPERLTLLPYQVDSRFWEPLPIAQEKMALAVGLERRDYETLITAVGPLALTLSIVASSHWARKTSSLRAESLPANVEMTSKNSPGLSYPALRELYSRSCFVVMPLEDVDFQAGITTILEAMAMERAVIVTRTRGQSGTVVGPVWEAGQTAWPSEPSIAESTGLYVRPYDAEGLRSAMQYLLDNPDVASTLGRNGRLRIEAGLDVDDFARNFANAILDAPVTEAVPAGIVATQRG